MKVSELIIKLKELKEIHGDAEVYIPHDIDQHFQTTYIDLVEYVHDVHNPVPYVRIS